MCCINVQRYSDFDSNMFVNGIMKKTPGWLSTNLGWRRNNQNLVVDLDAMVDAGVL